LVIVIFLISDFNSTADKCYSVERNCGV